MPGNLPRQCAANCPLNVLDEVPMGLKLSCKGPAYGENIEVRKVRLTEFGEPLELARDEVLKFGEIACTNRVAKEHFAPTED